MGVEIEVKYLVADEGWRLLAVRPERLTQGYLAVGEDRTVRVRIAGERAWVTLKFGTGIERGEFEYDIPVADAREMLAHATGTVLDKTRWHIYQDGEAWTVDEFHGDHDGLILAELEMPSVDHVYVVPAWVGEDVTHLPEYLNSSLATRGLPR